MAAMGRPAARAIVSTIWAPVCSTSSLPQLATMPCFLGTEVGAAACAVAEAVVLFLPKMHMACSLPTGAVRETDLRDLVSIDFLLCRWLQWLCSMQSIELCVALERSHASQQREGYMKI